MPPTEAQDPASRLEQLIQWLDEQQKRDRDAVEGAGREVQRLSQVGRDLAARLEVVEADLRQQRALTARLPPVEEALRLTREGTAVLQQQLAEAQEKHEQQSLRRSAESDRDRRAIAELGQRVAELYRLGEASQGRTQALAEELRRDRSSVAQLPPALEELTRRLAALTGRTQQLEEQQKRADNQSAALQQRDEQTRAELGRLDNAQRLAEIRWTRHAAEWQQATQSWREQIEEQAKPVLQINRQIGRFQDDVQALTGRLAEQQKRLEEQATALQRLEGLLGLTREAIGRVEAAAEGHRRRVEEQAAGLFRLEERLQRGLSHLDELERRLDAHESQIAEVVSTVQGVDAQRLHAEEGVAAVAQQLRDFRAEVAEELARIRQQHVADREVTGARLVELTQVELQHRRKRASAAQEEAAELAELARTDGPKAARPESRA